MTAITAPKKIKRRKYTRRDFQAYLYLLPWLIGFLLLQLYPFIMSLIYSFCNYQLGTTPVFNGLDNYIRLFTRDADFIRSLRATGVFTIVVVPGKLILSLAVAIFLNREMRGINLARTIYYIPSLFGGSVAVSVLWKILFQDNGIINAWINALGGQTIQFWGDPRYALGTICSLEIWQFGSSMVLFLGALKNVPTELYEAASVDGATKIRQFFTITIPMISPIIFFNMIMQTIMALQEFTAVSIITNGGPNHGTYLLGLKIYEDGFGSSKMGYACATSWILFLIILIVTLVFFKFSDSWVFYSDGGRDK